MIRSTKFPDKGSESELSKSAGCSESEPTSSLDKLSRSCRPSGHTGKTVASVVEKTAIEDRWASGVAGVTRRGSHALEHGRPMQMLNRKATGGYKGDRKSTGSVRESELPIVPIVFQGQHNLGRGKGQYFHKVSEEEKEREIA